MRTEDIKKYYWHLAAPLPPLLLSSSPLLDDAFPQLLIVVNTAQYSVLRSAWSAKYLPDQGQGQLPGQCLHPRRCAGAARHISLGSWSTDDSPGPG